MANLQKGKNRVWDARSGREVTGQPAASGYRDSVSPGVVSPDGRMRAVKDVERDERRGVRISTVNGDRELAFVYHDADPDKNLNVVEALAFSVDGAHVVTGGGDRMVHVWSASGQNLALIPHPAPVLAVSFSPDGRLVISAAADGTVRSWSWRAGDLVELICGRLKRNLTREEWGAHFGDTPYNRTCEHRPLPDSK